MKFNELEIGMLIDDGLITGLVEPGSSEHWGENGAVTYICIQDPYLGQCSRSYNPDFAGDFEILHPVGTPEYEKEVQRMIEDRLRASFDALEDVKLMRAYKVSSSRVQSASDENSDG